MTFAPTHLGTQLAVYTDADGNEVQPLAGMCESAFAFYDSLDKELQAQLYQGGPCPRGHGLLPNRHGGSWVGADRGAEAAAARRHRPVGGLADEQAPDQELAKIEASLDETYVNWSGATTYAMSTGDGICRQISGLDVYIEVTNQEGSAGADVARDTTGG